MSNSKPHKMSRDEVEDSPAGGREEGENDPEEGENGQEEREEGEPGADLINLLIGMALIFLVGLYHYIFGEDEEVTTFRRGPHHSHHIT